MRWVQDMSEKEDVMGVSSRCLNPTTGGRYVECNIIKNKIDIVSLTTPSGSLCMNTDSYPTVMEPRVKHRIELQGLRGRVQDP